MMAPKKPAITAKALQALLTRIGSASSGTKNALLARFQRDVQHNRFYPECKQKQQQLLSGSRSLRVMSIDMGIKNLAFCDAEVSCVAAESNPDHGLDAHMNILRWTKIDLMERDDKSEDIQEDDEMEDAANQYSPSVLSKTAYNLIIKEVLSVNPDVILIEKQRWRSGGGSAVQQWTVRVNTLEAMLWAILETLKATQQCRDQLGKFGSKQDYQVYAVDPKRVGQYWLSQHARAMEERNEDAESLAILKSIEESEEADAEAEAEEAAEEEPTRQPTTKKPSRSKAEKSAKIAILRSWLTHPPMSTTPSTPASMPEITLSIAHGAEPTLQALLSTSKTPRRRKTTKPDVDVDVDVATHVPTSPIKKLDDVTDCFLQAAAWVAWNLNRLQLLRGSSARGGEGGGPGRKEGVGEERVLRMMEG